MVRGGVIAPRPLIRGAALVISSGVCGLSRAIFEGMGVEGWLGGQWAAGRVREAQDRPRFLISNV